LTIRRPRGHPGRRKDDDAMDIERTRTKNVAEEALVVLGEWYEQMTGGRCRRCPGNNPDCKPPTCATDIVKAARAEAKRRLGKPEEAEGGDE
jgi:hypothetical protein